jgi:hypothetical protein
MSHDPLVKKIVSKLTCAKWQFDQIGQMGKQYKEFANKQLDLQLSFSHNYHMQLVTRPNHLGQIT